MRTEECKRKVHVFHMNICSEHASGKHQNNISTICRIIHYDSVFDATFHGVMNRCHHDYVRVKYCCRDNVSMIFIHVEFLGPLY